LDNQNPLRTPLTEEQRALLDVIHATKAAAKWPVYQHVEAVLDQRHGLDAEAVLASFPLVDHGYGAIWRERGHRSSPEAFEQVGLTVYGMASLDPVPYLVDWFLALLSIVTEAQRRMVTNPARAVEERLRYDDFKRAFEDSGQLASGSLLPPSARSEFGILMEHEPPLRGTVEGASATWDAVLLRPWLRKFRDTGTVDDYIDRVFDFLTARTTPLVREVTSPLSLPQAIDYLDVVWQLHYHAPLFDGLRATSSAKLAFACTTSDEFDSRISALGEVLNRIRIKDFEAYGATTKDGGLERLSKCLISKLPSESHDRTTAAIQTLKDIVRIRAGAQHTGAAADAAKRYARLGVGYPPLNLTRAWQDLSSRAIEALDAVREEIQATAG
jgi:hypothetical protein